MRSANRLFVLLTLLCTPLAPADGLTPSAELLTDPTSPLQVTMSLGCPSGAGPLQVTVSPQSEPPLFSPFSLTATDSTPTTIVSAELARRMCEALRAAGSRETHVEILLEYSGQCNGVPAESYYTLAFDLLCTDVSEIHAPSGTDPGPAGGGFTAELEVSSTSDWDGASVAFQQDFGESERQLLRVSVGIRETSVTVPTGQPGGFGLFSPARFGDSLPGPARIKTELELLPVDVSYGFRLLPPKGRVVPTLYVGAGYVFADVDVPSVEGGSFGDLLRPDREALGGRDDDSFTLNAGFSLRFNLSRRGRGGKYVYLGARTRWYAQRDLDETDEEIFLGFGVPTCNCGRR